MKLKIQLIIFFTICLGLNFAHADFIILGGNVDVQKNANYTFDTDSDDLADIIMTPEGNLGIGSLSPSANLDVTGNALISGGLSLNGALEINNAFTLPTSDGTANQVLTTNGSGTVTWAAGGAWTSSAGNITVSGNVGVNTTDPTSVLTLLAEVASDNVLKILGASEQDASLLQLMDFEGNAFFDSGNGLATSTVQWNIQSQNIDLKYQGTSEANLLFIDASADEVGIGTDDPGARLDLYGDVSNHLRLVTPSGATNPDQKIEFFKVGGYIHSLTMGTLGLTLTSGMITNKSFWSDTSGSTDAKLLLDSSGTGDTFIQFLDTGAANRFAIGHVDGDSTLNFYYGNWDAGTERLSLSSTGALQINNAFTFPTADGSANQVLTTDGAGTVSWAEGGAWTSSNGNVTISGNLGVNTTAPTGILTLVGNVATDTILIVRGVTAQSGNLTEWQDTSGNVLASVTSGGNFSNAGGYTSSEIFGAGAYVTGDEGTAIGASAVATADAVALGKGATATASEAIAIGESASVASATGIAIGSDSTAGTGSVAIGDATLANTSSIAIGSAATTASQSGVFVAGSTSMPMNNVFFGKGYTNATPTEYTLNGTGGSGTNIAGGELSLAGGKGTGNAAGGNILFKTSNATGSGTTLQSLETRMILDANGNFGIGSLTPSANLDVTGNAHVSGGLSLGGVLEVNNAFSLPTSDGSANQVLTTDGAGSVTWQSGGAWTSSGSGNVSFSGNVGIGSATPSANLDILGNVLITASAADYPAVIVQAHATQSDNLMVWRNEGGTNAAHITASGNFSNSQGYSNTEIFGRGATAGGSDTVVIGPGASSAATSNAVVIGPSAVFGGASNGVVIGPSASSSGANSNNTVIGKSANANSGHSNVVIGGSANATGNQSTSVGLQATSGGTGVVALGAYADPDADYTVSIGGFSDADTTSSIAIGYNSQAVHNDVMIIGREATSTTDNQLVIGSNIIAMTNVFFGEGVVDEDPLATTIHGTGGKGTDTAGADLSVAGGKGTGNANGGAINFQTSIAGGSGTTLQTLMTRMVLTVDGNLGVGSTTPSANLDVTGNAYISGGLTLAGALMPSGNHSLDMGSSAEAWKDVYVDNLIMTSDRRKKTDIHELPHGLEEILKLKPVTYRWKSRPDSGKRMGFIAQDVEEVMKEAVKVGNDEKGSYGVLYNDIIPVLVKGMQEQQQMIQKLQQEIKSLKAERR